MSLPLCMCPHFQNSRQFCHRKIFFSIQCHFHAPYNLAFVEVNEENDTKTLERDGVSGGVDSSLKYTFENKCILLVSFNFLLQNEWLMGKNLIKFRLDKPVKFIS